MASHNISIKQEAYSFLNSIKSKGKSFSDVILSFKNCNNIAKYSGRLKDVNWEKRKKKMNSFRDSFMER